MLNSIFGFGGRVGRLEFFLFSLGLGIVTVLLALLIFGAVMPHGLTAMDAESRRLALARPVLITMLIVAPFFCWFSFALQAKRFRDMGWNPAAAILGWIGLMIVDKLVAIAVPALAIGASHTTPFGALFNLGMCLCLWFWPSAPGGAGAAFDPRIFDENWPGADSAPLLSPSAMPPSPRASQSVPPPPQPPARRPGFGRRGL
jgi:uncharacterized membrane protein YhaH (DUF805 family)